MEPERRRCLGDLGICGLLALITVALYAPALTYGFVDWDDPIYVTENAHVRAGLTWSSIAYAWSAFDLGNWIPLTWMSLELDTTLFGLRPPGFHAVNVACHAVNVCLLFLMLRRWTGGVAIGSLAALFFAVHPLHVESVAWVSERKDVLSTFFLLLAVGAYERYAARPSWQRMVVVAMCMALGLLAKPMLVTLPVLFLLMDVWPLSRLRVPGLEAQPAAAPQRSPPQLVLEKAPLFLLSIADGLVTVAAQRSVRAMASLEMSSPLERLAGATLAYGWYLWKTLWPTGLCAYYVNPFHVQSWGAVCLSAAALLGVSYALFRRGGPAAKFGWLWFLVTLAPVSGLMQVGGQAYADRYAYVPHLGLFLMLAEVAIGFARRVRWGAALGSGLALLACLGCCALSRQQIHSWRDSETLWARALQFHPECPPANFQLGLQRERAGELEAATERYLKVVQYDPTHVKSLLALARVFERKQDWARAREYYAWALRLDDQEPLARQRLALLQREHPESQGVSASRPVPEEAQHRHREGLAAARAGKMEAALKSFEEALALAPEYAEAHNNAALALKELRRQPEARREFEQAVALAPDNPNFHFNFAVLLAELEDRDAAQRQFEEVLRLKPQDVEAQFRLNELKTRGASKK